MAIKGILTPEEFAKLPAERKSDYAAVGDGKEFHVVIDAPDGYEFMNAHPLRSTVERLKAESTKQAERLKAVEDLEKDPSRAREALKKWNEIANWSPDEKIKNQIAEHVRQVQEKFDAELKSTASERDKFRVGLDKSLRISAAERAIIAKGGKPKLLLREVVDHLKVEEKDGDFVVKVIGPDGSARITRKRTTDGTPVDAPMGLDELVETFKMDPEFAPAFAGSGSGGAGVSGSGSAGATSGQIRLSTVDGKDPAKYRAAKAEAAKSGRTVVIAD